MTTYLYVNVCLIVAIKKKNFKIALKKYTYKYIVFKNLYFLFSIPNELWLCP